jgi:hypothetical protein
VRKRRRRAAEEGKRPRGEVVTGWRLRKKEKRIYCMWGGAWFLLWAAADLFCFKFKLSYKKSKRRKSNKIVINNNNNNNNKNNKYVK